MTAIESGVVPITQEQVAAFKMPQVLPGTAVFWYKNALKSSDPQIGYVLKCASRSVQLYIPRTNQIMYVCRHVDDPKLRLNSDQREDGAWDFTDEYREIKRFREEIGARLEALEQKSGDDYQALRSEAIALGVEVKGNPKKDWLKQQIEQCRREQGSHAASSD